MTVVNKYIKRSRITEAKFREFLRYFCIDLTAVQITKLTGLNRNTVNRFMHLIRQRMAEICEQDAKLHGVIGLDESYFGPKRVRGKRGRGDGGAGVGPHAI
jgi:transposase